jgi:hypothetical protein
VDSAPGAGVVVRINLSLLTQREPSVEALV